MLPRRKGVMITISFITANYVARALGYSGKDVSEWGKHDQATLQQASPQTFADICRDITAAGFENIDVWGAHCHWKHHNRDDYLEQIKGVLSMYDLTITSYSSWLDASSESELEAGFKFMKQLGAQILAGGITGLPQAELLEAADRVCGRLGVKWAFENHPQKTSQEILDAIGGGKYANIGIALDTGWCGTQGLDALEAAKALREKILIVHLKDVTAAGGHDTCALGEGIVPVEKVARFLKDSGWSGNIAIEHEPFDRDPTPEVKTSLERLRAWLA
jgi:L-ribulose-5-phosphate 3-epimerase